MKKKSNRKGKGRPKQKEKKIKWGRREKEGGKTEIKERK